MSVKTLHPNRQQNRYNSGVRSSISSKFSKDSRSKKNHAHSVRTTNSNKFNGIFRGGGSRGGPIPISRFKVEEDLLSTLHIVVAPETNRGSAHLSRRKKCRVAKSPIHPSRRKKKLENKQSYTSFMPSKKEGNKSPQNTESRLWLQRISAPTEKVITFVS